MPTTESRAAPVEFDDTGEALLLATKRYELHLSKANGAVEGLVDRKSGASLTLGSRSGCLWGMVFPGAETEYVGGCSFDAAGPNRFTYLWQPETRSLVLKYIWGQTGPSSLDTTVEIIARDPETLDFQMNVQHQWGTAATQVLLPSDLVFDEREVTAAYAPFILPGVRLDHDFFAEDRTFTAMYPGEAFAAYLSLNVAGTQVAVYTVNPSPSPVQPVRLGFEDNEDQQEATFYLANALQTWIPDGQEWKSPVVRIRLGPSQADLIKGYRTDNGIDDYPSLESKAADRLLQLTQAPLIKADLWTIDTPFSEWDRYWAELPSPFLLHLVAFQPGGFDVNYPDFLPPDPRWGTTGDMRTLVREARRQGGLVMPYTNPTWWSEGAPTMEQLPSPLGLSDLAVLSEEGTPVYETYNHRRGIVVSPYVPYVRQRLDALMEDWANTVPVDCVFFDQIGARNWLRDFNPAAPSPVAYSQGWLEFTRRYADRCLMTEMGWDRLAETMTAFHGSVLTWERTSGYASARWGAGNWEPYPMALWLFHDKVLLYQHNLDGTTMATNRTVLTWDLAFGMMLSYVWDRFTADTLDSPWLDLVALLQRTVAARYAGSRLTNYEEVAPGVTRSTFGDLSVTANWRPVPFREDGFEVAASGFLARATDGSLVAGLFPGGGSFNGQPLSPGDHYLVVERTSASIKVHQPVGADTRLFLNVPEEWDGRSLTVEAMAEDGSPIATVEDFWHWRDERRMSFLYRRTQQGEEVSYYLVSPAVQKDHRVLLGTLIYPQQGWGLPSLYEPLLRYYDSSRIEVLDQQIAWMRYAGIDFALWQWIPDNNFTADVIDLYQDRPGRIPWAVQYESEMDLDPVADWAAIDFEEEAPDGSGEIRGERFVRQMRRLIDQGWATSPGYFTIDGRPVVYLWAFSYWRNWGPYVDRVFADYKSQGLKPLLYW